MSSKFWIFGIIFVGLTDMTWTKPKDLVTSGVQFGGAEHRAVKTDHVTSSQDSWFSKSEGFWLPSQLASTFAWKNATSTVNTTTSMTNITHTAGFSKSFIIST